MNLSDQQRIELRQLEQEIARDDNPALVQQHNVTQFWSDGTITSTKGGELFMQRSLFTFGIPVTDFPILHLPHHWRNESFAILTDQQANQARQALKNILYPGLPDVPSHFHPIAPSLQAVYEGRAPYRLP